MTSNELLHAVDVALEFLKLNKLCSVSEDDSAYYFTGCTDDGFGYTGGASCRVEKGTFKCEYRYVGDKYWNKTSAKKLPFPPERSDVFMKLRIPYGDNGEYFELDDG